MAEPQQPPLSRAQRIDNLKAEISILITTEGQLFQRRYYHNHQIAQQQSIHANASQNIEGCEQRLETSKDRESRSAAKLRKDSLHVEIAAYRIQAMAALALVQKERQMLDEAIKTHSETFERRKALKKVLDELEAEEAAAIVLVVPCGCFERARQTQEDQ